MGDRTLKIRGEANFSDIREEAQTVVVAMDRVSDSSKRVFQASKGLATDPAAFFAEAEAAEVAAAAEEHLAKARRSAGAAQTAKPLFTPYNTAAKDAEKLVSAQGKIRDLGLILGLEGLYVAHRTLSRIASLIGRIASMGAAGGAAATGAGIGLGAIAYAGYKYKQLLDARADLKENIEKNNDSTLERLHGMVEAKIATGELRGADAYSLRDSIVFNKNEQRRGKNSQNDTQKEIIFGKVGKEIPGIIREAQRLMGASFATDEAGAMEHAQKMAEITKIQVENEKETLRGKFESGLVGTKEYYKKLHELAIRSANADKDVLNLKQKQLEEAQKRGGLDADGRAKLGNELQSVEESRKAINERLYGEHSKLNREQELGELKAGGSRYRMPSDELSKIGLFVGGSGDSLPELSKSQLAELKQLNAQFRNLPSQIGGSL